MAYTSAEGEITDNDDAAKENYNVNKKIGDAIKETSSSASDWASWNGDVSRFAGYENPFFMLGGRWQDSTSSGLFSFNRVFGIGVFSVGFRPVLVAK
jgi:hypothetical protein